MLLRATGFTATLPFLAGAVLVVLLGHDGTIEHLGPLTFTPAIPVVLLAPLLLAVGCGLAHSTWPSAVVRQNRRTLIARICSYGTATGLSAAVVVVAATTSSSASLGGLVRNAMWLGGVSVATTAIAGIALAWLPVVVVCGVGLMSGRSDSPWSVYGWLFMPEATVGQLVTAGVVLAVGVGLAVVDPRSRGYLAADSGPS